MIWGNWKMGLTPVYLNRIALFLFLLAPIWHLALNASAQNNTLPQTVSDPAVADDLDYLFQKIVTINGVSSSGTINSGPLWSGTNGNIWNLNSGNVQIGPLGQPQNPQYQLDVNGNINTNATLSASTAVFGTGSKISTFTNLGSLLMSPASSVTYTSGLYISTLNALVPRMYFDKAGNISVNSSATVAGIPFKVQGQIQDVYDPVTNSGGQEVMVSKTGKAWDWTAGYGTGSNQNAFVMNETGILTTMICLPSGGSAPLCGINNNNITAHNPAYAWDVQGDINASGVYRDGTTAGITRTCTSSQIPNSEATLGGIVTGGTCDAVRDNQVVLTTAAIQSGKFGDDKVLISSNAMNNPPVMRGGDSMTGQLTIGNNSTMTVQGNAFSVGGSTLSVSGGFVTISSLTVNQNTTFISSVSIQSPMGLSVFNGSVTANSFFGDGSHLTGVVATQCSTCSPSNLYVSNNEVVGTSLTITLGGFSAQNGAYFTGSVGSVAGSTPSSSGATMWISSTNPEQDFILTALDPTLARDEAVFSRVSAFDSTGKLQELTGSDGEWGITNNTNTGYGCYQMKADYLSVGALQQQHDFVMCGNNGIGIFNQGSGTYSYQRVPNVSHELHVNGTVVIGSTWTAPANVNLELNGTNDLLFMSSATAANSAYWQIQNGGRNSLIGAGDQIFSGKNFSDLAIDAPSIGAMYLGIGSSPKITIPNSGPVIATIDVSSVSVGLNGVTTTNTSWSGCNIATQTITTNGGNVALWIDGDWKNSTTGDGCQLFILQDGKFLDDEVQDGLAATSFVSVTGTAPTLPIGFFHVTKSAPAAGLHSYCVAMEAITGGTCRFGANATAHFGIYELQ